MLHLPSAAIFQKFSQIPQKLPPLFQSQTRPLLRPQELPTDGADTFDSDFDNDEDKIRHRRAMQGQAQHQASQPTPAANPFAVPIAGFSMDSPETRAVLSNAFKTAVTATGDAGREEFPHALSDLSSEEEDKRRARRRQAGLNVPQQPLSGSRHA